MTLSQWGFLNTLPLNVPPVYLAASGLTWSVVGIPLFWGLWRGTAWAAQAMKVATIIYGTYYWLERLLLSNDPLRKTNRPFAIVLSILLVTITFWILSRPKARRFFGEPNER